MNMHTPMIADSLTLYLSEIRRFPLLSEEEEHLYALKLFEEKDLDAAHNLITSNLRFVVKVANEFKNYGMKMLDLIQEGNIGLMMAVRKFNPYKGIRLISYAVWWIRAYIQNYIISAWSLLKIGTTQLQRKLFFKLKQTKNTILKMTDGEEDIHATALALNTDDNDVIEMGRRLMGECSLDAENSSGDGFTLLEGLVDDRMNQEEMLTEHQESIQLKGQIGQALASLNEKERFIIEHRITPDDPMTLQEIADHFSISRERVRQIEVMALKKVKDNLLPLLATA